MPQQGNRLTTLIDLGKVSAADFDEFRRNRGVAPYFHDETSGAYLVESHYGPILDLADLDELDCAFLLGAQAKHSEGVRMAWPYPHFTDHPAQLTIQTNFDVYTLWPGSHILIPVEHTFLTFMHEFFANCEQLTR